MSEYPVDISWLVGQDENCAIQVDDPDVSGVQCRIDRIDSGAMYVVTDLGSTNGTWIRSRLGFVRRVRVNEPIQAGETLIVGRSEMVWASQTQFMFNPSIPRGKPTLPINLEGV